MEFLLFYQKYIILLPVLLYNVHTRRHPETSASKGSYAHSIVVVVDIQRVKGHYQTVYNINIMSVKACTTL